MWSLGGWNKRGGKTTNTDIWFRCHNVNNEMGMLGWNDNTGNGWQLTYANSLTPQREWFHIVITIAGSDGGVNIYKNGELIVTNSSITDIPKFSNNDNFDESEW
mgnify:CR=1 FL=1